MHIDVAAAREFKDSNLRLATLPQHTICLSPTLISVRTTRRATSYELAMGMLEPEAIQVVNNQECETKTHIDLKEDGTVLLESVQSQFQGATGLKYPFRQGYRAVKVEDSILYKPKGGWEEDVVYEVVFPCASSENHA